MGIKDIRPMDKITHSVRRSQAVLQYGVGAMIDFPSQVLMTAKPEEWRQVEEIHDERLEKLLKVQKFITPTEEGIPFVRFPRWYFCPKCREFKPIETWKKEFNNRYANRAIDDPYMIRKLICSNDGQELVPARIVVACEKGHIDDFPWIEWVHRKNKYGGEMPICENPKLLFKTGSSATSGLEGVEVVCVSCKARTSLAGAFDLGALEELTESSEKGINFRCKGKHPWKNSSEECELYPRTLQRGASSVYFPRTVSSLVIPPYSDYLNNKVELSQTLKKIYNVIEDSIEEYETDKEKNAFIIKKIEKYAPDLANEILESTELVIDVLKRKLLIGKEEMVAEEDIELIYKAEEYKALTGKIRVNNFREDEFIREQTDASLYDIPGVKSIALISKVKEVTALIGFSRIQPTHGIDDSTENFVSIKDTNTLYYPATVSKGEGIFIEFDIEMLKKFFSTEIDIMTNAEQLEKRYNSSFLGKNNQKKVTPEFLFVHTMAHALIKELSFNCGYPTASLRERVYCGEADGENMCGVFIYTTGGDAEGTLGGLVRQGRTDCLPGVFKRALKSIRVCANDPVCSFSRGQGMDALNLSACHTCSLLPETCCEFANVLLDRTVLIGKMDCSIKGFYSDWILDD